MRPAIRVTWLLLLIWLFACGGSQRTKTIKGLLTTTNIARDGFVDWDAAHQSEIVDKAKAGTLTKDEAKRAVDTYRDNRQPVLDLFIVVYRAISTAATQTDNPSLTSALAEGEKLLMALKKLKEDSP